MIQRNPENYTKEFFKAAKIFDGKANTYAENLKKSFNKKLNSLPEFNKIKLQLPPRKVAPENIIWVDASDDKLPATSEAKEVVGKGVIVNTRKELFRELKKNPLKSLVISQCVNYNCYNTDTVEEILKKGGVTSPGKYTAPGGIFSNKIKTYRMLSRRGEENILAPFKYISPENKSSGQLAEEILETVKKDKRTNRFFVKPTTGGGGLGGFRISKTKKDGRTLFFIPDLSRLSGQAETPLLEPLSLDPNNKKAVEELWWIYNKFASSDILKKNYIKVSLKNPQELIKLLKVSHSPEWLTKEEAAEKIAGAIDLFEQKFNRRYTPIVNHYINFGTWGLRAHYRLSREGIIAETIYARIFQIMFTPKGIGYAGADNISNKQTGELELDRLVPITRLMVDAVGGKKKFFTLLKTGSTAFKRFIQNTPAHIANKIPSRIQFDIAPVEGYICEGNADTARGFCLAQDFGSFKTNITQWYNDSVDFYSFIKSSQDEKN
ncbi:MAG: hypothetical protein ACQESB_04385 [Elusimicrobiota bacterium]